MRKLFTLTILFVFSASLAFSQAEQVKNYLKKIAQGKTDEVKMALPDLLADYPEDPGVLLVHASVLDDANKAVDIYEKIVKKHPESQYADDAYWRIVQYYAIKGDIDRAAAELENYRKKFPNSELLVPASDIVRTAASINKSPARKPIVQSPAVAEKPKKEEPKVIKPEKKTEIQPPPVQKPKEKPIPQRPNDDEEEVKGTWGLQVGIYSSQEGAKNEVERFRGQRLRAEIMPKKVDGALMYAVVIGDYSNKEAAEAAKNIVQQQCNCNPLIFKK